MAQIIFVSHAEGPIRNAVLWQVYHQLAPQAANPHSFWLGSQREECDTPQPMVFTAQNHPTKFKAFLSVHGRHVGVLCCIPQLTTILNGIEMLAGEGANIIVCGMQSVNELSEQFLRGGLQRMGNEYVDTFYLQNRVPRNLHIDANTLHYGILNGTAQEIVNRIINAI